MPALLGEDLFVSSQPKARGPRGVHSQRQLQWQRRLDPDNHRDHDPLFDPGRYNHARLQRHDHRRQLDQQPLRDGQRLHELHRLRDQHAHVRLLGLRDRLVHIHHDLLFARQRRRHVHRDHQRRPDFRHQRYDHFRAKPRHPDLLRHQHRTYAENGYQTVSWGPGDVNTGHLFRHRDEFRIRLAVRLHVDGNRCQRHHRRRHRHVVDDPDHQRQPIVYQSGTTTDADPEGGPAFGGAFTQSSVTTSYVSGVNQGTETLGALGAVTGGGNSFTFVQADSDSVAETGFVPQTDTASFSEAMEGTETYGTGGTVSGGSDWYDWDQTDYANSTIVDAGDSGTLGTAMDYSLETITDDNGDTTTMQGSTGMNSSGSSYAYETIATSYDIQTSSGDTSVGIVFVVPEHRHRVHRIPVRPATVHDDGVVGEYHLLHSIVLFSEFQQSSGRGKPGLGGPGGSCFG